MSDLYPLRFRPILRRDIADHPENYTRMVIVAPEAAHYDQSIPCKTSLIFSTIHEQGALARCIHALTPSCVVRLIDGARASTSVFQRWRCGHLPRTLLVMRSH